MNTPTVASAPRNGHPPTPDLAPLSAVTLGWLAASIDKLGELRAEKRRLEAAERALTAEVLRTMAAHGLPALRAESHAATVGTRTDLVVDPVLFVEAVGGVQPASSALRVLIEPARLLLDGDTLAALSETRRTPTLRVDAIR